MKLLLSLVAFVLALQLATTSPVNSDAALEELLDDLRHEYARNEGLLDDERRSDDIPEPFETIDLGSALDNSNETSISDEDTSEEDRALSTRTLLQESDLEDTVPNFSPIAKYVKDRGGDACGKNGLPAVDLNPKYTALRYFNPQGEVFYDTVKDVCLKAHNQARKFHLDTPPLQYDNTLACHAQAYAEKLVKENMALVHDTANLGPLNQGENLFRGAASIDATMGPDFALKFWYAEMEFYTSENGDTFSAKWGHYTQVVWRATTHVGCGWYYDPVKKATIIVARYGPPGNAGQYGTMVSAAKGLYEGYYNVASNKLIPGGFGCVDFSKPNDGYQSCFSYFCSYDFIQELCSCTCPAG